MCGIVGILRPNSHADNKKSQSILSDLIVIDTIRGFDSTGLFAAKPKNEKDKTMYLHKCAINGAEYVRKYHGTLQKVVKDYQFIIGHNRWATVGKVNSNNAHPFVHGDIVGVHNGTLENQLELDPSGKYSTDSESLIARMDKIGDLAALKEARGALAVVWFNKKTGRLSITRNEARPLHFACIEKMKAVVIASEESFIEAALSRNGFTSSEYELWELNPNNVITFNPDNPLEWSGEEISLKPYQKPTRSASYLDNVSYLPSPSKNGQSRGETRSSSELKKLGLQKGTLVPVVWESWEKYTTGTHGKLSGVIPETKFKAVCHGIGPIDSPKFNGELCIGEVNWLSAEGVLFFDSRQLSVTKKSELKKMVNVVTPKEQKPDAYGTSPGEKISFYVSDWVAYQGSPSYGKVTGCMDNDPFYDVVIHNVHKTEGSPLVDTSCEGVVHFIQSADVIAVDYLTVKVFTDHKDDSEKEDAESLAVTDKAVDIEDSGVVDADYYDVYLDTCPDPIGPDGTPIPEKEFDMLTRHGCVQCSSNIFPEDSNYIAWTHENQPYCLDCSRDLSVRDDSHLQ